MVLFVLSSFPPPQLSVISDTLDNMFFKGLNTVNMKKYAH